MPLLPPSLHPLLQPEVGKNPAKAGNNWQKPANNGKNAPKSPTNVPPLPAAWTEKSASTKSTRQVDVPVTQADFLEAISNVNRSVGPAPQDA